MAQWHPVGAFVASIFAAVLILSEGILLAIAGGALQGLGYLSIGGFVGGLGALEAFIGFLLLVFAIALFIQPASHRLYGSAILVLSVLSWLGGGGFIIGLILGVIGGLLGIFFVAAEDLVPYPSTMGTPVESSQWYRSTSRAAYLSAGSGANVAGSAEQAADDANHPSSSLPSTRRCPLCGATWPSVFTVCTRCGASLSSLTEP